ncbi:MAG: hypothetical protein ACOVJ8_02745 [Sediminibacterium sp.]
MKNKEEIEQLANEWAVNNAEISFAENSSLNKGYIKGYTQCQEDMADKKYTEEDLHTILRLRKEWYSHTDKNAVRDFIQSLNKQD